MPVLTTCSHNFPSFPPKKKLSVSAHTEILMDLLIQSGWASGLGRPRTSLHKAPAIWQSSIAAAALNFFTQILPKNTKSTSLNSLVGEWLRRASSVCRGFCTPPLRDKCSTERHAVRLHVLCRDENHCNSTGWTVDLTYHRIHIPQNQFIQVHELFIEVPCAFVSVFHEMFCQVVQGVGAHGISLFDAHVELFMGWKDEAVTSM